MPAVTGRRPDSPRRCNDEAQNTRRPRAIACRGLAAPPADHPHGPVAGARAVDWDFTAWCYASGHDAGDQDARLMFECLLAYARREGRAGLN